MKLKSIQIVLTILFCALLCAVPSSTAAEHEKSAWFSIHFRPQEVKESDSTCLEPGGRYFSSLDTGDAEVVVAKQENNPVLGWLAGATCFDSDCKSMGETVGFGSRFEKENDQSVVVNREKAVKVLLARTDAYDVHNLQDKLFGVIRDIVFAILVVFISGFLLAFSGYWHDGKNSKDKAAIWGYVLSLDLGFIVLAMQGYWSHDRLWGLDPASLPMPAPELVMVLLVGGAWYTFLRGSCSVQRQPAVASQFEN